MIKSSVCFVGLLTKKNNLKYYLRLCHKTNRQQKEKPLPKLATDVVNYINSTPDYKDIKDKVPNALLKKYKSPESMYIINKKTANEIVNTIKNRINNDSPLIEVNPGFGFLSEELLQCQNNPIYMYEMSSQFSTHINKLQEKYPGRIKFKVADFFGMWKLAFKDKMDQGNRIEELLGDLCTDDKDRVVKIIGSMPGLSFVKHLINNIIFHNSTNQLGKPDLFITMPGHHYKFLTDNEVQLRKHRSIPALFQMLFDHKVLTSVPKVHFLPWTHKTDSKKNSLIEEHTLLLVNITQKDKLPCPSEYLPLLWYFFRPHMFSKSTRVIPMLEQWIPGCGVWLITGQDPPDTNKELAPNKDDAQLPHMTIFTEFGDLNLQQKITVFKKFISWPEFDQCQFRVTMENNLPKFITHLDDDDKEGIGTHIEDIEHSDVESDA
ncbi:dimethyladenosine transferase 2, mitochondrial isoform X1 [Helicoverpa zea]|uniref:dimethyladenosine transferase 2, mitochondrial isoform X1 n=1 Tax=Helicoverpa zea TaxID=7113 RepID=UPI001F58FE2F|nr:dimethyladenosine transferase 2, mitochondrial isoform X1 [Helicoverpa zea]